MQAVLRCLALAFVVLAALPGAAGASHNPGPGPPPFVGVFPSNPNCSSNPNGFVEFTAATPFGPMTVDYCKDWPTPGVFTAVFDPGTASATSVTGNVVCLTYVGGHTAIERDLIITSAGSNSFLFPPGFGLLVKVVDNDSVSQGGNQMSSPPLDEAGMFLTPPPSPFCPTIPVSSSPVIQGSFVVHL